jgi:hypothetical protein
MYIYPLYFHAILARVMLSYLKYFRDTLISSSFVSSILQRDIQRTLAQCYGHSMLHVFNCTCSMLFEWHFLLLCMTPMKVWRPRTPECILCAHFPSDITRKRGKNNCWIFVALSRYALDRCRNERTRYSVTQEPLETHSLTYSMHFIIHRQSNIALLLLLRRINISIRLKRRLTYTKIKFSSHSPCSCHNRDQTAWDYIAEQIFHPDPDLDPEPDQPRV